MVKFASSPCSVEHPEYRENKSILNAFVCIWVFTKQFTFRGSQFFLKRCLGVCPFCHCWCPPFSAGHAEFPFICFPGSVPVLLVSALLRWPCRISIRLSSAVTAGVRPSPLAMQHFYEFICLPLSLLVSALFRWPCNISISILCLPCYSFTFLSRVWCLHGCPPFSAGHAAFLCICLPDDLFTFVSQVRCLQCWCPPFSAGHAAFLFIHWSPCHFWCPQFSCGHAACLFMCLPLSLLVSALFVVQSLFLLPIPRSTESFLKPS